MLFKVPQDGKFVGLFKYDETAQLYLQVPNVIDWNGEVEDPAGTLTDTYQLKFLDQNGVEQSIQVVQTERRLVDYVRSKAQFAVGQTNDGPITDEMIRNEIDLARIELLTDVAINVYDERLICTYVDSDFSDNLFQLPVPYVIDYNFGGVLSNADVEFFSYEEDDDNTSPRIYHKMLSYDPVTNRVELDGQDDDTTIYMNCWYTDRKPILELYELGLAYRIALNVYVSQLTSDTQSMTNPQTGETVVMPVGMSLKVGDISIGGANVGQLAQMNDFIIGRLNKLYTDKVKSKLHMQRRELEKPGRTFLYNLFDHREYR